MGAQVKVVSISVSCLMSLILVERVFKFVGSVPQGDDVKRKDLLVCFSEVQLKRSVENALRALDLMPNFSFSV